MHGWEFGIPSLVEIHAVYYTGANRCCVFDHFVESSISIRLYLLRPEIKPIIPSATLN